MNNLFYYFYKNKVETATVEITSPGWQSLTSEEIITYKNNDYDKIVFIDNKYYFIKNNITIDLEEYKNSKIGLLSMQSFDIAETIIPDYKYKNCLISKNLVERGEDPIYENYIDIMLEYENSRVWVRQEFYRCKEAILKATSIEEIDNININYEKRS